MAVRGLLRRTTPLDRVLVLLMAGGCLLAIWMLGEKPPGRRLVVLREEKVIFTSPLEVERTVSLEGPLGETVLSIHGGGACILSSPCPRKVCMGMGEVARRGELLACVPNGLLVRIEGGTEPGEGSRDYDLLSR